MNNVEKGFIATIALLIVTILTYITKVGGNNFILFTDILAVVYSFVVVLLGIFAVKIYSLKSLQGKVLFSMVLGSTSWFLAELIWLIFLKHGVYYSEFLRFFGYAPFVIGFFITSDISDPEFRKHKKKLIYLFIIFLISSVMYLNIVPIVFGGTSLLENLLNNGYIVADFILLFGVYLLLKTSLAFKKGSMSFGWLVMSIAFMSTFIFDVYFAFNFKTYLFGDIIEIFWLTTYVLLAYGFFYHYQVMKNFLKFELGQKEKVTVPDKRNKKFLIMMVITIFTSLLSIYLFISFVIMPSFSSQEPLAVMNYEDGISVIFTKEVLGILNNEYNRTDKEYLFCLMGNKTNNEIYIDDLIAPELVFHGQNIVISHEDPSCQIENSLGAIHSHLEAPCSPSTDDIFSWGEMKNPEPIVNAIQCGIDDFYIILMPYQHKPLDLRPVRWKIAE